MILRTKVDMKYHFFQASLENSLSFAALKTQAPKLKLRLTQDHFISENFRNT